MTTSSSTRSEAQGSPTWVLWLFGIALIILFIWLWNTANSAKSTAEANASLLARPQAELHYLVGGPARFGEEFQEAIEDAELEGFASDDFLWSTVLVSNTGVSDLDDVDLALNLAEGLSPTVLASLPSFGSAVDVVPTELGIDVGLREIGDGESALVFLGFDPAALPQEVADGWRSHYQNSLGSLTVEAGDFTETLYGRGV